MRKFFTTVGTFLICSLMLAPLSEAQSRGRGRSEGGGAQRTESHSRPGNSGNHNQGNNRPGNSGNHNQGNNRPGNNGNHYAPGPNHGHNPGHNVGHNPGRPAPVAPPPPHYNHGHNRPPYVMRPPVRPFMPVNRPWARPVPPPGWRPYHGAPTFTGVLGVIFGTALDVTLNSLLNTGYTVTNYGPSAIYMTSVPMLNYTWPNATINFVNGVMRGSEFTYSTSYYDLGRYNGLYNQLVSRYGAPVSYQNNGQSMSATWWGYDNGYITLNFFSGNAYNGTLRYFTTLSIGN